MSARRNFFIRSIATVTGDIAIGYALASICVWVIQFASLGLFLSFLLVADHRSDARVQPVRLAPGDGGSAVRSQARSWHCFER
jgi:hypothetical protein